jgi:hypothetical protein
LTPDVAAPDPKPVNPAMIALPEIKETNSTEQLKSVNQVKKLCLLVGLALEDYL